MNARRPRLTHLAVATLVLCPLLGLLAAACSPKHHSVAGLRNERPVALPGADVLGGVAPLTVQFTGSGSDSDGTVIGFVWDFGDGAGSSNQSPQHTYTTIGDFDAVLFVTDNGGVTSAPESLHIVVNALNNPPTANAGGDKLNNDPGQVVALGGAGSDPDGNAISYQWTRVAGPSVTLNNASTQNASFTVPAMTTASWTFRLTVTDDGVPPVSATDDIVVTSRVTWANTVAALMADRPGVGTTGCTSCHFTGNLTGRIPWDNYADVFAWRATIRVRIASAGNMRGYLLAGEPEAITAWIDNGAPQTN